MRTASGVQIAQVPCVTITGVLYEPHYSSWSIHKRRECKSLTKLHAFTLNFLQNFLRIFLLRYDKVLCDLFDKLHLSQHSVAEVEKWKFLLGKTVKCYWLETLHVWVLGIFRHHPVISNLSLPCNLIESHRIRDDNNVTIVSICIVYSTLVTRQPTMDTKTSSKWRRR